MLKQRLAKVQHPLAKKVLALALSKKTNLCLSLDVTDTSAFLDLAEQLGPHLVMLKTHIDIMENFTPEFLLQLQKLAKKYQFFLFEDRKFADIGNTAKLQYERGIYHIASWADFITCHALPGAGMIEALSEVGAPLNRAAFMLIEMSSSGNLLDQHYQNAALKLSVTHPEFLAGFIAQQRFPNTEEFLYCMPGISLAAKVDGHGQQYKTPAVALQQGADILIVGRGLYQAENPSAEIERYREAVVKFL